MSLQQRGQNVTPLDMLPDLEDLERSNSYVQNTHQRGNLQNMNIYPPMGEQIIPPQEADKYAKFIRNDRRMPPPEAGMAYNNTVVDTDINIYGEENDFTQDSINEQQYGFRRTHAQVNEHSYIACIDIADHISNCPICSKFYNTDKSLYIISIVVLVILCILLLKKVLDV